MISHIIPFSFLLPLPGNMDKRTSVETAAKVDTKRFKEKNLLEVKCNVLTKFLEKIFNQIQHSRF